MSKEALAKVVQRAISDGGFRRQLSQDPTGALRGYDLSGDETAAVRSGDAGRLSSLGVDQRMSKAFSIMGEGVAATRLSPSDISSSAASIATGNDASLNSVQKFELGGAGAAGNAIAMGGAADSDALVSGDDASLNAVQKFELEGPGAVGNALADGNDASVDAFAGGTAADGNALDAGTVDPTRIADDLAGGGGGATGRAF